MKNNLLDLFYNFVVKEALTGRIHCFFTYNMIFSTKIVEDHIELLANTVNSDLFIPTLEIKNRLEFDHLLLKYVDAALAFYPDEFYCEEIRNRSFIQDEYGVSKEKLIMILLWSNATIQDFANPCQYLRRRISFFELGDLAQYLNPCVLGYSEILNANVEVQILKNRLEYETPYSLNIFLKDVLNDERIYEFPAVYMGVDYNCGYIYAIQNKKDKLVSDHVKKIERRLYHVNHGFDGKNDNFEYYDFGNLKDITPSFLVAANVMVGLFRSCGISQIHVSSILISRWNAKVIGLQYKMKRLEDKKVGDTDQLLQEYQEKNLMIQSNLTEKFLRIFRRLEFHHSSISIFNYPMELSSDLILNVMDSKDVCNNLLLDETYSFSVCSNLKK